MSQLLKFTKTQELLAKINNPLKIWEYFLMLTEVPRPSGKLDAVRARITEVAQELPNVTVHKDSIGNLVLRKAASPSMAHLPGICVQGHMDMVTTKEADHAFDFNAQPIEVMLDGGWIKAYKTTLGADNGIGVAAGLALLAEEGEFPLLECLITADEETTMAGAEYLSPNELKSKFLINCDSEEEYSICMGCAGGQENIITLPVEPESIVEGQIVISMNLSGCNGGHSGCSIHEGFANAGKIMNRILYSIRSTGILFGLAEYSAGNAVNAIPSYATASIVLSVHDKDVFIEASKNQFQVICEEYINIEGDGKISKMQLEFAESASTTCQVNSNYVLRILDLVSVVPHGILRMSPDIPGLVESSTSMALLKLDLKRNNFLVHCFTRSSRDTASKDYALQVQGLCRLAGAVDSGIMNPFPGWTPNINSRALVAATRAHVSLFAKSPRIYSVHAGLETGFIVAKYPQMDCISIGPTILNAHTVEEKMDINSVDRFWKFLIQTIHNIVDDCRSD